MTRHSFHAPHSAVWAALLTCCVPVAVGQAPERLTAVPIQQVTVRDGFWSPKIQVWKTTTINDVLDKFDHYGGFKNFDRVAAGATGGHHGEPWWDGLIYETLRGAADFLAANPDAQLQRRIAALVDRIAAAADKDPDGYVNTAQTLDGVGVRWSRSPLPGAKFDDNFPHTVYNAGCLIEAGAHLYKATGDAKLLKVATRMANYMTSIMGPPPKQNIIPGHAVGEEALTHLYRLFRDEPGLQDKLGMPVDPQAYLDLARFWIENRGHAEGRASEGAYNQDDVPIFKQATLEGHAVRSALLAAGVAAAAAENGRQDYRDTGARWWNNMVGARMYLTGGLGAVAAHEGFGADYELPNDGYAETCAAVAGGFFSHNMNLLTGDAKYVDTLERELYNGALSGTSLAGNSYFYENPLTSGPSHQRWPWRGDELGSTPCCPPMFLKLMGAMPGYIYATKAAAVYVNLYVGSKANISTSQLHVKLAQTTKYPWDGSVNLAVSPASPGEFALNLRIPGWAKDPHFQINGQPAQDVLIHNHYAVIKRQWNPGDTVLLQLPMPIQRVTADPRVTADAGRVALMRGPIVYCFEGMDNDDSNKGILLSPTDALSATYRENLLGGVVAIEGQATLLRRFGTDVRKAPASLRAIPFFTNSNRGPTTMDVWIAADMSAVQPVADGKASASYCNPTDSVAALNDGIVPQKSDDASIPRMTWWNHKGTDEWAQLTFSKSRRLSGASVYWWDERRINRECRVPRSWHVEYLEHDNWQPVKGATSYGTAIDAFNRVTFQGVDTTAIRVVVQLQDGWSGGILEMSVAGADKNP
ncbi:MAG: beta-L-arabinofuranosidase domain-containing protein [Verrucomicrobiota bacterium]